MSLLADNTRRWQVAKFKPSRMAEAREFAKRAIGQKPLYVQIADQIKAQHGKCIPWWVIPLIHERECLRGTRNLDCSIGQGSPWNRKSKVIPYSGPFGSFVEAAVDSLVVQAPRAALWTNWSGGGVLTINEAYNGLGYARKGRPSPYIWAGSDQYVSGKYIADGKYDPKHVDTQLGVAIMLKAMMEMDSSIVLDGDLPKQDVTPRKAEAATATSLQASVLAWINGMSPYYTFTWWDITGFVLGAVVITGVAIYLINRWKRTQLQ
jgi:lysozyme family protein